MIYSMIEEGMNTWICLGTVNKAADVIGFREPFLVVFPWINALVKSRARIVIRRTDQAPSALLAIWISTFNCVTFQRRYLRRDVSHWYSCDSRLLLGPSTTILSFGLPDRVVQPRWRLENQPAIS